MSTIPAQGRTIFIGMRTRLLINLTALYIFAFIGGFAWFYNFDTSLGREMLGSAQAAGVVSAEQVEQAISAIQAQIRDAALPAFIISYAVLAAIVIVISYGQSRPLVALAHFAERVAHGDYSPATLPKRTLPMIHDEISVLSEVFTQMVDQVREREESLKKQVVELQIKIDQHQRDKQVGEVVESEFFGKLKEQAREMRARGSETSNKPEST